MACWDALPAELRLSIWETYAEAMQRHRLLCKIIQHAPVPCRPDGPTMAKAGLSLAPAAAVNRSWQAFFERVIFRSLVLDGRLEVDEFAEIVRGKGMARLAYVRHLRLYVRLDDYDCTRCFWPELPSERETHNRLLSRALWPLLATLGKWTAPEGGEACRPALMPGLTLELSAGSWSDTQHFPLSYPLHRRYPFETAEDLRRANTRVAFWRHQALEAAAATRSTTHRSFSVLRELTATPLNTSIRRAAPALRRQLVRQRLDIVRALVVRWRFRHQFDDRLLVRILELGARSILTVRIEERYWRKVVGNFITALTRSKTPLALQSLHAMSNYNGFEVWRNTDETIRTLSAQTAAGLFHISRQLRHITILLCPTADHFFSADNARRVAEYRRLRSRQRSSQPQDEQAKDGPDSDDHYWPHLEMVSLGAGSDWQHGPHGAWTLLHAAALAQEMPRLRILEICNAYNGTGRGINGPYDVRHSATRSCFFRFEAPTASGRQQAAVTICGNWDVRALWTKPCKEAWEAVATALRRSASSSSSPPHAEPLVVRFLRLDLRRCPGQVAAPHHGSGLDHPDLVAKKFDPVTLDQLRNITQIHQEQERQRQRA